MKVVPDYWKQVRHRAFEETAFFAQDKMLLGLAVSILGFTLQWAFGIHPWSDVWKILLTVVVSYVIVMSLAFISKVITVPAVLDQEKTNKVTELDRHRLKLEENLKMMSLEVDNREIARQECEKRLAAHPVIQQEQRQLDLVRSKLREVTADERHVLRFVLDHGKMRLSTLQHELAVYGPKVDSAVSKATQTDLIMLEVVPTAEDRLLYVNPALEPALKIVLGEQLS